jgi:hypothetical protein
MVCQSPLPGVANSSCSCSGSRAPYMACNQTNGFWLMVFYVWVVMASSKVVSSRVVVFESEGVSLTPAWCGKTHHVVVVRVQGAPSTGRFWSPAINIAERSGPECVRITCSERCAPPRRAVCANALTVFGLPLSCHHGYQGPHCVDF